MKALSLHQPWASLISLGVKTIETRHWSTNYRGPLAIHAAKTTKAAAWMDGSGWPVDSDMEAIFTAIYAHDVEFTGSADLPYGAVVATCELVDVVPIVAPGARPFRCVETFDSGNIYVLEPSLADEIDGLVTDITDQAPYGDYSHGRFAWLLDNITPLDPPVPAKGHQGLWNWET